MMITTHLHSQQFQGTQNNSLVKNTIFDTFRLVELHTFRTPLTRNRYHFRRFYGIPFIFEGCRGEACRLGVFWVCGEQVSWILVIHKYTLQGTIIWDSPNGKNNIIDWKVPAGRGCVIVPRMVYYLLLHNCYLLKSIWHDLCTSGFDWTQAKTCDRAICPAFSVSRQHRPSWTLSYLHPDPGSLFDEVLDLTVQHISEFLIPV